MGYLDALSKEKLAEYEVVEDWVTFFNSIDNKGVLPIDIENKIFKGPVSFTGRFEVDISFQNCFFIDNIAFFQCEFEKNLSIHNCFVDGMLATFLDPVKFNGDFTIVDSQIKSIFLRHGHFTRCTWSISDSDSIIISNNEIKHLTLAIGEKGVKNINIIAKELSGTLYLTGGENYVGTLSIEGFSKDLTLSIVDLNLDFLFFNKYRNEDGLRLVNIQPASANSKITFLSSYLGKAEFTSIDFSNFESIVIDNSHIVDCTFNNVIWSNNMGQKKVKLDKDLSKSEIKKYYLGRREVFRQLKSAMAKQGDIVNEQKFHAIEMLAHYKMLSWAENFWTKLIIKLSFTTSDFGQSFWRPLLSIFVIHSILFLPLIFSGFFTGFEPSLTHFSWNALEEGINSYFFLMNPFRKVDESMFKGAWILIDILMRISASYMIYNMVRATRRFIK